MILSILVSISLDIVLSSLLLWLVDMLKYKVTVKSEKNYKMLIVPINIIIPPIKIKRPPKDVNPTPKYLAQLDL